MLGFIGRRIATRITFLQLPNSENIFRWTKPADSQLELNVRSLTEGENGTKYAVEVTNRFAALEKIDDLEMNWMNAVDNQWEKIHDAIVKSAETTIDFCEKNKNKL